LNGQAELFQASGPISDETDDGEEPLKRRWHLRRTCSGECHRAEWDASFAKVGKRAHERHEEVEAAEAEPEARNNLFSMACVLPSRSLQDLLH
jgi:hypothetical protein